MQILGFIPARKGSKGIKGKNLIKFNKKPLILSTIKFSKKLKFVTPFVSTDSKKILNYLLNEKIKFNYLRPKNLSTDKSNVIDAVMHVIKWFEKQNIYFDAVMMLQPTTPVRKLAEVNKIIKIFKKNKKKSVISVTKMKEHPYECIKIYRKNWDFIEKNYKKKIRRQDYPQNYYFIDGSVYLASINFIKKNKSFVVKGKTILFKSSQYPGIDIDDYNDIKIAELFVNKSK